MTELAHLLQRTSQEIPRSTPKISQQEKSRLALCLDDRLEAWKTEMGSMFDLEGTSLTEREYVTKRKVVLKLRKTPALLEISTLNTLHQAFTALEF